MPKLPEPPAVLPTAALVDIGAGERVWRIYFQTGPHPITWSDFRHFGPTAARFDHHDPPPHTQLRGILYAATGAIATQTCLAEVFQSTRIVDRVARSPWLVGLALARPLTLLDLTGTWPTVAGASMAINSGPRPRARRWSRAIYTGYPDIDGLLYASSMNANAPALALYERAASAFPSAPLFHRSLADPTLTARLNAAATKLGYGLI